MELSFQISIPDGHFDLQSERPLALWISGPVLEAFGIDRDSSSPWVFWPLRILVMTPTYQLLLVVTGTILGQHQYFWPRFMKRLRWIGLFRRIG